EDQRYDHQPAGRLDHPSCHVRLQRCPDRKKARISGKYDDLVVGCRGGIQAGLVCGDVLEELALTDFLDLAILSDRLDLCSSVPHVTPQRAVPSHGRTKPAAPRKLSR